MTDRRNMQFGDWLVWIVLMIVGALLGLVVVALVGLDEPAFLPMILYFFIPIGFAHVFFFFLFEVTGSGQLDETKSNVKKAKPLFLLVSLPAGFLVGVIAASSSFNGSFL